MSDEEIPADLLEVLLENANWAPTHGMTEPWRFKVFRGAARTRLAESLQRTYKETTPESSFRQDKFEKLGKNPLLAPVVIAVCMRRQEIEKIPEIEEIEAVACAVHNMHLTASAAGLAAFWSSPPIIYGDEIKSFLGLEEKDRCLGLFYLGFPRHDEPWPESTRRPVSEKTEWVGEQTSPGKPQIP